MSKFSVRYGTGGGSVKKSIAEARNRSIMRMHRNGSGEVEIAAALNISPKAVNSVIRRFRQSERASTAVLTDDKEKAGGQADNGTPRAGDPRGV